MSEENKESQDQQGLEQGTYEIIRGRLNKYGSDLKARLEALNVERKNVFGAVETELVSTEHISTSNSCEARDMIPVGDVFIFGYNVRIGLKTEMSIKDVFSVYQYQDRKFREHSPLFLQDDTFISDFKNLYKYYREAKFTQFIRRNGHLYFIFQTGKELSDVKSFKWLVNQDNSLTYIDSRSEHEVKLPEQYGFDWKRPNSDHHRDGAHPHISIEDKVFVEAVGGDLTIKIEDNTDTGKGIYEEPVEHQDQSLNDAEVSYAIIGEIIVLKIRPYQEKEYRYIVYNHKVKEAMRVDSLEQACVLLPEDHGIIFPQGYCLQSGEYKLFDFPFEGIGFQKCIPSSNGEDFLYVFYNKSDGTYTLLLYNLIEQGLKQPIHCNGFSIFDNGEMCLFRSEVEAKKHHSIQIWQTPFAHVDTLQSSQRDAYLFKIGNKEIVTAMAECRTIIKLIDREEAYGTLYIDLSKMVRGVLDAYHWIPNAQAQKLSEPLINIEGTAESAMAEFDKVLNLKKTAKAKIEELSQKTLETRQVAKSAKYDTIDRYVETLTELRAHRGAIITAKEMRYIDTALLNEMEEELLEMQTAYSNACVEFLLTENALLPYQLKVDGIQERLGMIKKVVEANELDEDITKVSAELELLIDIVNSLNIEDSTVTTKIINNITDIFYRFNRIIADLKKARKTIFGAEAENEFKSQLKLIQQGASNYINLSDTPDKCDESLNRLIIQLEELDGKFADFPEFGIPITEAREEIHNAFESHKLALVEARNNRSVAIQQSTERILQGIKGRLEQFKTANEINAYLASDMLVQKVRDNIGKLLDINDSVKADDLGSQLKSLRENALRQLRDKTELFADGDDVIKLGAHSFSVNTKKLDVTLVKRRNHMCYHLTGTSFFDPITDAVFNDTKHLWDQPIISENTEVYRGEYLAYLIFNELTTTQKLVLNEEMLSYDEAVKLSPKELIKVVQKFMSGRYEERYIKGVHDEDATKLLIKLYTINMQADLLIYPSSLRAEARYRWQYILSDEQREDWNQRLKAYGLMQTTFGKSVIPEEIAKKLTTSLATEKKSSVADYLFLELSRGNTFVMSPEADRLKTKFTEWLKEAKVDKKLKEAVSLLSDTPNYQLQLYKDWLRSYLRKYKWEEGMLYLEEAAVSLLEDNSKSEEVLKAKTFEKIEGLIGEHGSIQEGNLSLDYTEFMERLERFHEVSIPAYREFQHLKHARIESFKKEIRLESFVPKIMTSFVRNKLINDVYLPLVGNNLAKQIGVAGADKRTDLMGMLLLISPPGYGKTTLMEYIAQRVGLIFVKINGPALGHDVTSVDPESATNSAAREELNRLNLAFEMGDNVMIYLDDIQHCNSEFLQKFISLCDGQRKIEGVYKGESKTYDFRGRKVMVVMAGNPYTESGERFQIPDMLANRSDIYNLGDVIGGKQDVFELSYIENCLTSNAILGKLNNKSFTDVYQFIKVAMEGDQESMDLEANYSSEEVEDYVNLLKRVITVKDIVFKVNLEYIISASMEDQYRTAPPFKLQGSYRDMNKIVEKLVPVMNDEELQTLIISHYENESQTLTSSAESSLLRFKELFEVITPEEMDRWNSVKETYVKTVKMQGIGESNEMALVISQMESISEALNHIGSSIDRE